MENISTYISYKEATHSTTANNKGIKNEPDQAALANMKRVATEIFDVVRAHFGVPIIVSSFFRCKLLNTMIGGSATSDHPTGCAIDVKAKANTGITNRDIFEYVQKYCTFDQLIWEHGTNVEPVWVHFSKRESGNRMQVLRARKVNGKTVYETYK